MSDSQYESFMARHEQSAISLEMAVAGAKLGYFAVYAREFYAILTAVMDARLILESATISGPSGHDRNECGDGCQTCGIIAAHHMLRMIEQRALQS